jgi:carbon-monoxide dehydrogenase small subunit
MDRDGRPAPPRILDVDGQQFTGTMRVALGPIKATFSGRGARTRNDAAREGSLTGQGRDTGSGSLAQGEAHFIVGRAQTGPGTVVDITLTWRLSGMLAQFSRTGLIQSAVRQIATEFASNLEASIAGAEPSQPRPLRLLALLWAIVKARLFRH